MRAATILFFISLFQPKVLAAQTWQAVGTGSFEFIAGVCDGSLLVIQYPSDILRSTDNGITWSVVYRAGAWQGRLVSINDPSPSLSPEGERSSLIVAYSNSGAALVSKDSGRTWARIDDDTVGVNGVGSAQTGALMRTGPMPLASTIMVDDSSNILLSRDGGISWERVLRPNNGCVIHSIGIIDSVCYAVGEPGLMYVSDNTFEHWVEIHRAPFPQNAELETPRAGAEALARMPHIDFSSGSHGAIAVGDKIYLTDDSGTSWRMSIIPDTNSVSSIWITDTSLIAGMSDGKVFYGPSSGDNFIEIDSILYDNVPGFTDVSEQRSGVTAPVQIGWKDKFEDNLFVLNDSILYEMNTNIRSASSYQLPMRAGEYAESACFPDRYTGFLLTDSITRFDTLTADGRDTTIIHDTSVIYRTLDGGSTWNEVLTSIPGLRKISFINSHRGFVCGAKGLIMRTDDSGSTWSRAYGATRQNLWDVKMVNDSTGYATGDSGAILCTRNAGRFWQLAAPEPLFSHPATSYHSIAFSDFHTVYVIGSDRCYKGAIPSPISAPHFTWHRQQRATLGVAVSPNPSNGQIDIQISSSTTAPTDGVPSLVIDDISGRPVVENVPCWPSGASQWSAKVNLPDVNSGVYVAVATMGNQTARCNFVIEK